MKTILPVFIAVTMILMGCSDGDEIEKINDKKIYTYANGNSYNITDINLYSGPLGHKVDVTEEQVQSFFIVPLNSVAANKITIDLKSDSIHEFVGELKSSYEISIKEDSIFIHDKFEKSHFYGILSTDQSACFLYKSYYFYRCRRNSIKVETSGSVWGVLGYPDNFRAGTLSYMDDDYSFLSPSDMKNEMDAVCWVNVKYAFSRIK